MKPSDLQAPPHPPTKLIPATAINGNGVRGFKCGSVCSQEAIVEKKLSSGYRPTRKWK